MAPILYVLGAGVLGAAAWWQRERIKPGDIITVKPSLPPLDVPIRVKVTSTDSKMVYGTVIGEVNGVTTDTKVPASVERKNIIANLYPRFW